MTSWPSYPTATGDRNNDGDSVTNFYEFPTYMIAVIIIAILILLGILFFGYVTVRWCHQKQKIRERRRDETSGIVSQTPPEASV
jgi:hypothetical protein